MNKKISYYIIHGVLFTLYIGLMVFFIVMCLQTGTKSSESSGKVAEVTANAINTVTHKETVKASDPSFQKFVRKFIGHYSYFVVLGLVSIFFYLMIPIYKKWFWIIIHYVIGFSFAIFSEFALEGKTTGRGPSWGDVGIDSLGFLSLSVIIIGIYYLRIYLKKRKNLN